MLTKTSMLLAAECMSCEVKANANVARWYSLGRNGHAKKGRSSLTVLR
jgi:hypothetical protein